jgi:hypothetical protein
LIHHEIGYENDIVPLWMFLFYSNCLFLLYTNN